MNIIVFGASGGTGKHVVEMALADGHSVTAFVRQKNKLTDYLDFKAENPNLHIVEGDALNAEDVTNALAFQDAVISCLGGNGLNAEPVLFKMTEQIIQGMKKHNIRRIAYCASAGVHREIPAPAGWFVWLFLRNVLADHRKSFELLSVSGLEWTLARPMRLSDEPPRGEYRRTTEGIPRFGNVISRTDVASFLLDAVTENQHIRESVGLAY